MIPTAAKAWTATATRRVAMEKTSPKYSSQIITPETISTKISAVMPQKTNFCPALYLPSSARHATPVWSPRGDYIAFTRMESGRFSIGVMRPDGSGARTLTTSFLEESPTWAPNGRRLMFTRQEGPGSSPQIWEVDIRGGQARRVQTPGAASDPAWGPPMR